eukprot:SAG31_NODE_141_length_22675_cov_48.948879_21_plen_76_part_00
MLTSTPVLHKDELQKQVSSLSQQALDYRRQTEELRQLEVDNSTGAKQAAAAAQTDLAVRQNSSYRVVDAVAKAAA